MGNGIGPVVFGVANVTNFGIAADVRVVIREFGHAPAAALGRPRQAE